jgi:fumarylacetoacetase
MFVGDYTDFYSSFNHAYNIGVMVRGHDNAIQPNWKHLPVGYHGRASSIVIDGTPIIRPRGQVSADKVTPSWSECKRMDFELELGTIVSHGNKMGHPIKTNDARDHIFGYVLLNDWSARDMQVWEYVPLGPFNAKNFGSTISPWVITPEALAPFKVALNKQEPELLKYLKDDDLHCYNVDLKVKLKTAKMDNYHELATSNAKYLYFSVAQCLAHHTVTGCNFNTGDMIGSGTISGPEKHERGSIMELCWGGKEPITLPNEEVRTFL